ncbi:hypothetical protein, partial [Pseudomonas sp. MWU16-30323]|uniref:hypothetical protein n=1 Tax=Pseudomonas sp. MWU16-30323 TaxID=2878094 RepID=UPI001CFB344D
LLGGFNLYQYAPNSVIWTDPSGWECGKSGRGFLSWAKKWHDKRVIEIFGPQKGRNFGRQRSYDSHYKGRDIEYKSDNFKKGLRSTESLNRMTTQIDKDIKLKNSQGANPHWHFEHDPRVAPEMGSVLQKLESANIPWTFGPKAPF